MAQRVEPVADVPGGVVVAPVPLAADVDAAVLESVVARICALHDVEPTEVRRRAVDLLHGFAGARIQAFVPILVEKRLRAAYRSG